MIRKIVMIAVFGLLSVPANAASRVWIAEFSTLAATQSGGSAGQIASLPSVLLQSTLDISGGVQASAAFNAETRFIRVICEVQCAVRGDGQNATTSSILMPALAPEYFGVKPGATVSVIAAP
jgi:hypothetical protein